MKQITIQLEEFLSCTGSRYLVQEGGYVIHGLKGKDVAFHTTRDLFKKITRWANATYDIHLPANNMIITDLHFPMREQSAQKRITGEFWARCDDRKWYTQYYPEGFSESQMQNGMIWCSRNSHIFLWRKKTMWLYHPRS